MTSKQRQHLMAAVDAHALALIRDPEQRVFAVGVGEKVTRGAPTGQMAVTLVVPPGEKGRYRRRTTRRGQLPRTLSDGRATVYTDVIEAELPQGCAGAIEQLRARMRPWSLGMEIARAGGGAGTAGLLLRWPGDERVCGPYDVLLTARHVVERADGINVIGARVRQPASSSDRDTIGLVSHLAPLRVHPLLNDQTAVPDVADLAVVSLTATGRPRLIGPWQPPDGANMDALADQLMAQAAAGAPPELARLMPGGAPWCGYPHYHASYNNRVAVLDSLGRLGHRGYPRGLGHADLGDAVAFTGRTSGTSAGRVVMTHGTTWVKWGTGRYSLLSGAYWVSGIAQQGDSGAGVLDEAGYCIGLVGACLPSRFLVMPCQPGLRQILGARAAALRLDE